MTATARNISITGSKARLAQLGRALHATVTANARTGTPVLIVPVAADFPYVNAGTLPDGRVSAMRLDTQAWEFLSAEAFINVVRGWTPEKGEQAISAESHRRMARIRTALDVDRRPNAWAV